MDLLAEKVHAIVIADYPVLVRILGMYQSLKYSVVMQSESTFRVGLGQAKMVIHYSQDLVKEFAKD